MEKNNYQTATLAPLHCIFKLWAIGFGLLDDGTFRMDVHGHLGTFESQRTVRILVDDDLWRIEYDVWIRLIENTT